MLWLASRELLLAGRTWAAELYAILEVDVLGRLLCLREYLLALGFDNLRSDNT